MYSYLLPSSPGLSGQIGAGVVNPIQTRGSAIIAAPMKIHRSDVSLIGGHRGPSPPLSLRRSLSLRKTFQGPKSTTAYQCCRTVFPGLVHSALPLNMEDDGSQAVCLHSVVHSIGCNKQDRGQNDAEVEILVVSWKEQERRGMLRGWRAKTSIGYRFSETRQFLRHTYLSFDVAEATCRFEHTTVDALQQCCPASIRPSRQLH